MTHDLDFMAAARLTCILASIGLSLDSFELIAGSKDIAHWFPWRVARTRYVSLVRWGAADGAGGFLASPASFQLLAGVRIVLAAAAALVFGRGTLLLTLLCAGVLVTQILLHARLVFGLDGADQMQSVIWGGLTAFSLAPTSWGGEVAVLFIGLQLLLSYVASGASKFGGSEWRRGTAVSRILRTSVYGSRAWFRFVERFRLSPVLSWGTVAIELLVPLAVLVLGPYAAVALLVAGMLHLAIAVTMGLNNFLWAFVATYPCVLYVALVSPFRLI